MASGLESWATQQLAEFLGAIATSGDVGSVLQRAVERAAEALEAEAGAVVTHRSVAASVGFPAGLVPEGDLMAVAEGRARALPVPGVGRCATLSVPLEDGLAGCLLLARAGDDGFSREEANLLRGMGRALALTTKMLRLLQGERALRERSEEQARENARLLSSLRERQALLERLSEIQRSIVHRADLQRLLDAVVAGARDLLGVEVVGLRLVDRDDPTRTELVAHVGIEAQLGRQLRHRSVDEGAGGKAIEEGRLVVFDRYEDHPAALPELAEHHLQCAMAAPVHENAEVCGSLMVASRNPGRTFSASEREMLLAFAEHASIALTDARNFANAMRRALQDSLTGLPNRALFVDRLDRALRRAERLGMPVAVLFLDLDGFKTVNDSLGHGAGDELLVAVAGRLESALRPGDSAARFGGDEFALLLENLAHESEATVVAARLLDVLRKPIEVTGQEVFLSASIGIATARRHGQDLLRNADLAMYQAKNSGKDRYELFEPSMHAAIVRRLELEGDLQRAIDREEFCLYYQPIVRLRTGRIIGVEALLRWRHPERGLLPPAAFVPLAEETRLVVPIGRWVLREACRQAAAWRESRPALAMGVNLSSLQLQQPELAAEVAVVLRETGFDARSVILEITETVLMQDVDSTKARLRDLKELGVHLAVDDFGTGYSSLQYLRRFPIDILKIAKSFVDGVAGASDESALARAIIDLGESFQLRVVAEGIEQEEQLEKLVALGCELGQGYLFAKPMPADDVGALLLSPDEPRLDAVPSGVSPTGPSGEHRSPAAAHRLPR